MNDPAHQRRQAIIGGFAGLAVVVAIMVAFVIVGNSDDSSDNAGDTAAPAAAQSQTPAPAATTPAATPSAAAEFPPLPAGADPALATKPATSAGTGELTKLAVKPLVKGKGPAATAGQGVTVNYVGVLYKTGEEFDASWSRSEPFTFQLGVGNVIPGFDQGLIGVKVGSRVQLDIPSKLAYGDNPDGNQPPGPLRFIVDVLAVG